MDILQQPQSTKALHSYLEVTKLLFYHQDYRLYLSDAILRGMSPINVG